MSIYEIPDHCLFRDRNFLKPVTCGPPKKIIGSHALTVTCFADIRLRLELAILMCLETDA